MEIKYKEPKLKDSLYGEMLWREQDEEEAVWFGRMKDDAGKEFMLYVQGTSPLDFLLSAILTNYTKKL